MRRPQSRIYAITFQRGTKGYGIPQVEYLGAVSRPDAREIFERVMSPSEFKILSIEPKNPVGHERGI